MDKDLEKAYMAGLDASVWWQKFTEFLYESPAGQQTRRELAKDFVEWQKQAAEFDPKAKLLTWQEMMEKMFPNVGSSANGKVNEKHKGERVLKAKKEGKVRVIEMKPKPIKKDKKITGGAKAKKKKGAGGEGGAKKKSSAGSAGAMKFKNI